MKILSLLTIILCGGFIRTGNCENITDTFRIDLQRDVPIVINDEDSETTITFNITVLTGIIKATFSIEDDRNAKILGESSVTFNTTSDGEYDLKLSGKIIGRTYLSIIASNTDQTEHETVTKKYEVVVTRVERPIDVAFNVVIILLVVIATMAMGCKIEVEVVKQTLKKPIAPLIGILSQFLFMPAVSFLAAYFLDLDPAIALGYFALGCSPGGSASNVYTYFFGGDISLSVTMTLVSTVCSLGLLPMWLFTVGQKVIYKGTSLKIPYTNIFTSLLGLIVPVLVGMVIQYKKPNWAKKLVKLIKPIVILFLVFALTVGIYANLYIFRLLNPVILIAGALIPYSGFLLGLLIAFVTKQPRKNIIAIAIETGIQNTGIPIVLLRISLSPPESDISIIGPIASSIFTPLPLICCMVAIEIRKRWCKKKTDNENMNEMLDEPATFSKLPDDTSPETCYENNNLHNIPLSNDLSK